MARPASGGFTLLEMIVVLGIIMLIMGITLGGIFRLMHTNPILAAEQVVAGFVRQARHTARSSGAPVVIEIRQERNAANQAVGGTIAGVSREALWTDAFEAAPNALGVSGGGLHLESPTPYPPAFDYTDSGDGGGPVAARRLVRTAGQSGFYLGCAVRPPAITGGAEWLPLLMIGRTDDSVDSLGGVMLHKLRFEQQKASSQTAWLTCWEIVGWLNGDPTQGGAITVSSTDPADRPGDIVREEPVLHITVDPTIDVADPIGGERWEEIGLLFDRHRLVLYRNGQRVGEKTLPATAAPPSLDYQLPAGQDAVLVVGGGRFGMPHVPMTAEQTTIDDARLFRLNLDQLGRLPRNIVPKDDYRIVAHPDGRVEAMRSNGTMIAPPGGIELVDRFDDAKKATITVLIDGRTDSSMKVAP